MILVKLGGSVLTNKGTSGGARFSRRVALRLLREIRSSKEPFVLVHGAGSFAHPLAMRYGIGKRKLSGQRLADAVARTQAGVRELRTNMLAACDAAGLSVVDVPAGVIGHAESGNVRFDARIFEESLSRGLSPVTGGDVILDERLGARVLSGDEILALLAAALNPKRVVFVSDTDGLRIGGKTVAKLSTAEARKALPRIAVGADATGGMRGKIEQAIAIAETGVPVVIVNGLASGRVARACKGANVPATTIVKA